MPTPIPTTILPGLHHFADSCNVYVLQDGAHAIAIDFGGGEWLAALPGLGITQLDHVLLTHHHADQCAGLAAQPTWSFAIHAPVGEERFLDPARAADFGPPPWLGTGCPASYAAPATRIPGVRYDLAGFGNLWWRGRRVRVLHTPGHGPHAVSFSIEFHGHQLVFCGDAVHAGATIWQPYHLEWDHWTGGGALAAWEGIERLRGVAVDLLLPAHGPVIRERPRQVLATLARRLLAFYHAKGPISPGAPDLHLVPATLACGAFRYLPHLYQFGMNGYLLTTDHGTALVVDPFLDDLPLLDALCRELGVRPTAATATHYHYDHLDGLPAVKERYGATTWLHPLVAECWRDPAHTLLPWLTAKPIVADLLWPARGTWTWEGHEFQITPWSGQTWWHCAFMTVVDGQRVMFAGDSFQPAAIWNGTGGFCAYNQSRFRAGFHASAQLALAWRPQIMAAGHTNCYRFAPSKFRQIARWSLRAEAAVLALCPHGDLERDYYSLFAPLLRPGLTAPTPQPAG